jgi:hypothetical protein
MKLLYKLLLPFCLSAFLITGCNNVPDSEPVPTNCSIASDSGNVVTPQVQRVILVILENLDANTALQQPFLKSLAKRGAYLGSYFSVSTPSQPNYIALISGSTYGVHDNNPVTLSGYTIGDLLDQKGMTWKSYAEDYPGNCFLGATSGKYARKHEPFLSFDRITTQPSECAKIVNASQFQTDVDAGTLPNFSLYIPNLDNDGHDTPPAFADQYLSTNFGPLLDDPTFMRNTLFVVTFDEGPTDQSNQVYTAIVGPAVKAGARPSGCYNHYSLLRTLESVLGLDSLRQQDATVAPISGIWN